MLKIQTKYIQSCDTVKALQNVRTWLSRGLEPLDGVRQLSEVYKKAKNDQQRRHLGFLLSSLIEAADFNLADECARRFNIISQQYHIQQLKGGMYFFSQANNQEHPVIWKKNFSYNVRNFRHYKNVCDLDILNSVFELSTQPNVFAIHPLENIFVLGDADNRSCSLVIVHGGEGGILIDEEPFSTNPPKYFTEKTYFTSPVYRIKLVKQILEHILLEIGFPYFRIKTYVVFCHKSVRLINRDEYENSEEWKDIRVLTPEQKRKDYFFSSSSQMIERQFDDSTWMKDFKDTLYNAFKATAIVYERLSNNNEFTKLTPTLLRHLTRDLFEAS